LITGVPELWVEFKKKGKEPTPGQWSIIRMLRKQGREVWVEDDVENFKRKLGAWYVMMINDKTLRRMNQK